MKENIINMKWDNNRIPLWKTNIANSGYICSALKLIKIKNSTMGLLSTVLEEGVHKSL